jgi:hypothetical protein
MPKHKTNERIRAVFTWEKTSLDIEEVGYGYKRC